MISRILVAASATIIFGLGITHLVFTFFGPKLTPRDPELVEKMKAVSPVLTRQTTMWKAWIGFNASHSFGAVLFGLVYGYLAVMQRALLFHSVFLPVVGGLLLLGYLVLGQKYWFSAPFRGILLASVLYAAGFATMLV